jgi:hypothetical protein
MLKTKAPNSQASLNSFSTGIENLVDSSTNLKLGDIGNVGQNLAMRAELLKSMVNKVDKPILKQMASDMLSLLSTWTQDPQVLCCLIHGIWSFYTAKVGEPERQLRLADTEFSEFLDMFINLIDLIIIILTEDIKKISIFFPDIIRELVNGILGAILLVVQETLYALRDSVISVVFTWLDAKDTQNTWIKCLPFKQLLNLMKKYIHDYGLIARLNDRIKGYTAGLRLSFSEELELPIHAKDLEFLYWLRGLLIKLKNAVLNFDFCVDYTFVPSADVPISGPTMGPFASASPAQPVTFPIFTQVADTPRAQGYTTGADGTILVDPNKVADNNGTWLSHVSNSFIREFLHKEYNLPYDVVDNTITKTTSADVVQGMQINSDTSQAINDKCAFTPTAKEALSWMLNIRNRMM